MSNPKEQPLTLEDRLKAIAYQFIKLYERWSEDRQVLMKQAADTATLMQAFEKQLNQFKKIDADFRENLGQFIRQEAANVAEEVGDAVGESASKAATKQVKAVANALQQTVDSAQAAIQAQTDTIKGITWVFWAIVFTVSLVGGLSAGGLVYHFMIKPPALTHDQQITMGAGEFLQNVWPKLSKPEQQRLLKIANSRPDTTDTDNSDDLGNRDDSDP